MEVNADKKLFGYQHTSKYLLLCHKKEIHADLKQHESE